MTDAQNAENAQIARDVIDAPDGHAAPDDRWGFRAKRQEFLTRFGFPGTPAGDRMEAALSDLTDALLREARYHATWPVATAERWRYDRMLWVFGVMLGEVPADTPAPPSDGRNPPGEGRSS